MNVRMRRRILALAAAVQCVVVAGGMAADGYPEFVAKGVAAADAKDDAAAIAAFNDALLLKPEGREAAMNLGLALARSGEHEEAVEKFDALAERLPGTDDAPLRARALYNRGRSQIELANAAIEKQDRDAALEFALKAIASGDEALAADPKLESAEWNREQARHLLERIAKMPPPPPQEGEKQDKDDGDESKDDKDKKQNEDGKGDDSPEKDDQEQQNKEDEQQDRQPEDQDGDGKDSKGENQPEQQEDPQDAKDKDGSEAKPEPGEEEGHEGQAEPSEAEPAEGMSEREAQKLLQMLADEEMMPVNLMRVRSTQTVEPEKQW